MTDIPKALQARIDRVTRDRYLIGLAEFKRQRTDVIHDLRERGTPEPEIAKLLNVSIQYLGRVFPRASKEIKP